VSHPARPSCPRLRPRGTPTRRAVTREMSGKKEAGEPAAAAAAGTDAPAAAS